MGAWRHTHTHTYRHHGQKLFQETSCASTKGRRSTGLKNKTVDNNTQLSDQQIAIKIASLYVHVATQT